MAKKSRKRVVKDQSGCIKSLIHNIFDFRQGRSSQKLLQDKKHESKRIARAAYPESKLESLNESSESEICKGSIEEVQCETSTIDPSKMSVKELMAEEMLAAVDGPHVPMNRRRARSMTSLKICADDLNAPESSVPKNPNHRRHKSLSSMYLNAMVEELCSQISHNKEDDMGTTTTWVIKDPSVKEEKLWEASRVLISQFSEGKSVHEDGKIHASEELVDALRVIESNKDTFLKLLKDPNSQLVKNIQSLQDVKVEGGKFKVLTGTSKQQNFFWRKLRGLERNPSRKNDPSEDLNRIVVLKPSSFPESGGKEVSTSRASSSSSGFSFAEFKRRLKHVMGKEERHHQLIDKQPSVAIREKRVGGETMPPIASPSRDHFFIERIPKSSTGAKKGKLKDGSENNSKKVSNIYVEAKKHLAEIIGNKKAGVDDGDDPKMQQPARSLGGLMSFSGYSSPNNPKLEGDIRSSQAGNDQIKLETDVSDGGLCESSVERRDHRPEITASEVRLPDDAECCRESNQLESSFKSGSVQSDNTQNSVCSEENWQSARLGQDSCAESEPSSSQIASTKSCSVIEKIEDRELMSNATSKPSPISVLDPLFSEDVVSPPGIKSTSAIQPRQIQFEEEILAPSLEQFPWHDKTGMEDERHTFNFVKAVVEMSGMTWDELHRRTLFSDHFIDPSLLDEVDFLPDLLPCDFNILFDLVNEVVIEIAWLNFGSMVPFSRTLVQSKLKGKDVLDEVWEGIRWYLELEGSQMTLDQVVSKDLSKSRAWMNLQPDSETIGIQLQEAILEELVEDAILSSILP